MPTSLAASPRLSIRLSIVVPTHDTRELTMRCLASLRPSEAAPLEVVLVDDASRDGTAAAAEAQHPGLLIVRNETAAGFTKAANAGMARARGEVLLLLNSDTEVEPGALSALLEALEGDPELGIAGAALRYPDGSPQWSGGKAPSLAWLFALSSGLPGLLSRLPLYRRLKPLDPAQPARLDWVTGAALAIRRAAWEAVGPLDEDFRFYGQDLDLCLRARRAGWEVAVIPAFRVIHHHGATIGQKEGSGIRQHHALLWTDLLRWARKQHGDAWARRAAFALRFGGALRLAGRRLAAPFVPAAERQAWHSETGNFRRALAALPEAL